MNDKSQGLVVILPITVIALVLLSYLFRGDIGSFFNPGATANDIYELTQLINEQIDSGKKSGTFYVSGVTEEDIKNINDYVCGLNGMVGQYSITDKYRNGMRVIFKYKISDNYYVYQRFANGKAIPEDHPSAYKLYDYVEDIIGQIITPGMTDYEKELAIHDYIVTHCRYGYTDYAMNDAYRAYGALVQNTAVCNGYAEAMSLLLSCVGIENDIMFGSADGELHAWNRVKLDGRWYQVDPTWDDPLPDRGSFAGHMYFNVTDDIMDDMHVWNMEEYEECSAFEYNYFEQADMVYSYDEFKKMVNAAAQDNSTATIEAVVNDFSSELYDWETLFEDNQIVQYYSYDFSAYGEYDIITIYLNQ